MLPCHCHSLMTMLVIAWWKTTLYVVSSSILHYFFNMLYMNLNYISLINCNYPHISLPELSYFTRMRLFIISPHLEFFNEFFFSFLPRFNYSLPKVLQLRVRDIKFERCLEI